MTTAPRRQPKRASEASSGKRRFAAMAAVVALATVAGALGGALATAGARLYDGRHVRRLANNGPLEASVARIDADIARAEGQPRAHLQDRGRASSTRPATASTRSRRRRPSPPPSSPSSAKRSTSCAPHSPRLPRSRPRPAAAKDVTGSVAPPRDDGRRSDPQFRCRPSPKSAGCRRSKAGCCATSVNGSALIESRRGIYEVYAGDPVPGLGRVDAIRKQDGRWVVVTSKGLIVAR